MLRFTWQARTTLLCGVVTPLIAALLVNLSSYVPQWERSVEPVTILGVIATLIFLALPVGFLFGVVPGLVGGALYSYALTLVPYARPRVLFRAFAGAALAGLVGGLWCQFVLRLPGVAYGAVAALSGFLFALRWPRVNVIAPSNNRWRGP